MKKILQTITTVSIVLPLALNAVSSKELFTQEFDKKFISSSNEYIKCGLVYLMMTKSNTDTSSTVFYKSKSKKAFNIAKNILFNPLYSNYKTSRLVFKNSANKLSKELVKEFETNGEDFNYMKQKYINSCNEKIKNISETIDKSFQSKGENNVSKFNKNRRD